MWDDHRAPVTSARSVQRQCRLRHGRHSVIGGEQLTTQPRVGDPGQLNNAEVTDSAAALVFCDIASRMQICI